LLLLVLLAVPGRCRDGDDGPLQPSAPATDAATASVEPTGAVTLRQALALALMHNPELKAFPYALRAAEARVLQARLLPNPKIEVEVEEFGGSGYRSGFDAAEMSLRIGQRVELGGKRDRRTRLASLGKELVDWDYESARADVIHRVTRAFAAVLAAQARLELAEKVLELSRQAQAAVAQRVQAGKDSPVAELRADVVVSQACIETQRAAKLLTAARQKLASLWGSRRPSSQEVTGDLYEVARPEPPDRDVERILENPDLARWKTEQDRRRAAMRLEKARAVSDVTIAGGVQRFEETDDSAFIVGLAIPLPLFDRNQGGVQEAAASLARTREQYGAAQVAALANLSEAASRLSAAYEEVVLLRDEVLPKAEQAFAAAGRGYREGKFDYLAVLDTQRTLFETQAQFIDAAEAYHAARADVERLTGQPSFATGTPASPSLSVADSKKEISDED
jgi:cobalt-zinc-cadmium efflux system outer membrane protein